MPHRLSTAQEDFATAFDAFLNAQREAQEDVENTVRRILDDVRRRGDAALFEYTETFDRISLTPDTVRLGPQEIAEAAAQCDRAVRASIDSAAARIADFHRRQMPETLDYTDEQGIRLGARWTAVDAVGLYTPGGRAAYPSSLLMNAIPAAVAGVERIAMAVPTPGGVLNPALIAAAERAGVSEIYRVGGAQAVGALAYGTESIAAVDKIVGPGNAFVATAKRQVFGTVGIDMIAGPSEILVVADAENNPDWIAADLLSQAEHGDDAQSILITDNAPFAEAVASAIEDQLTRLDRAAIAGASWRDHGAIILVRDLAEAPDLVDAIAPEHLELAVDDPDSLAVQIRHAGAMFLGRHTPEAIGDYIAGPNHVLPTSRTARFASGLNLLDFMKRTTWVGCTPEGLAAIGPDAATLAEAEGLGAHGLSVTIRLGRDSNT